MTNNVEVNTSTIEAQVIVPHRFAPPVDDSELQSRDTSPTF